MQNGADNIPQLTGDIQFEMEKNTLKDLGFFLEDRDHGDGKIYSIFYKKENIASFLDKISKYNNINENCVYTLDPIITDNRDTFPGGSVNYWKLFPYIKQLNLSFYNKVFIENKNAILVIKDFDGRLDLSDRGGAYHSIMQDIAEKEVYKRQLIEERGNDKDMINSNYESKLIIIMHNPTVKHKLPTIFFNKVISDMAHFKIKEVLN